MRRNGVVLWVLLASWLLPCALGAQDKPRATASKKHRTSQSTKHKADKAKPPQVTAPAKAAAHAEVVAPTATSSTPAAPQPTAARPAPQADAEEDVRKEGGTEVKTLEFGGLDIEGQLKTPQMLYFLNRLRAEFERPQLPHRSFMPELQRSTKENAF
jgi:hypothetical protein